jgi:hypothetical protein
MADSRGREPGERSIHSGDPYPPRSQDGKRYWRLESLGDLKWRAIIAFRKLEKGKLDPKVANSLWCGVSTIARLMETGDVQKMLLDLQEEVVRLRTQVDTQIKARKVR